MSIKERCTGVFIIQVRGGLNDCAVPSLHVDPKKREVSLDWKALFNLYFSDKANRVDLVNCDAVSNVFVMISVHVLRQSRTARMIKALTGKESRLSVETLKALLQAKNPTPLLI